MNDVSHSLLVPFGDEAASISRLFYVMASVGFLIWAVVIGLSVYAIFSGREHPLRRTRTLVIGGGAVLPTVVLTVLLIYALSLMPQLHRAAPDDSLRVRVNGVRWWWRIEYLNEGGEVEFETANELYMPVGRAVAFELESEDVIHSFWIPSVGGKMDMIPGRRNILVLAANRAGVLAGKCTEFCGDAHAQMNFRVVSTDGNNFEAWRRRQSQPATEPSNPQQLAGREAFFRQGCAACHSIRGTEAAGPVGPDLTHFGSRLTIGAAVLDNTPDNLKRWIVDTHDLKPGVEMPEFDSLAGTEELDALVAYLESLK